MSDWTRRVHLPTVLGPRQRGGDWHEPAEEPALAQVIRQRRGRRGDETPVAGVPTVRRRGWQLRALGALL